jgi:hypothetical protein
MAGVFHINPQVLFLSIRGKNNIKLAKGQGNLELRIKNSETGGVYALIGVGLIQFGARFLRSAMLRIASVEMTLIDD